MSIIVHETDTSGVGHGEAIWELANCPICRPRANEALSALWDEAAAAHEARYRERRAQRFRRLRASMRRLLEASS